MKHSPKPCFFRQRCPNAHGEVVTFPDLTLLVQMGMVVKCVQNLWLTSIGPVSGIHFLPLGHRKDGQWHEKTWHILTHTQVMVGIWPRFEVGNWPQRPSQLSAVDQHMTSRGFKHLRCWNTRTSRSRKKGPFWGNKTSQYDTVLKQTHLQWNQWILWLNPGWVVRNTSFSFYGNIGNNTYW